MREAHFRTIFGGVRACNTPLFLFDLFCWTGFSYLHNRKICKFAKLDTELLKSHPNERSALMVVWSLSSNLLLKASRILSLAKDTTKYEVSVRV